MYKNKALTHHFVFFSYLPCNTFIRSLLCLLQSWHISFVARWRPCSTSWGMNLAQPKFNLQTLHEYNVTSWGLLPIALHSLHTKIVFRLFFFWFFFSFIVQYELLKPTLQPPQCKRSLQSKQDNVLNVSRAIAFASWRSSNFLCPKTRRHFEQDILFTFRAEKPFATQTLQTNLHWWAFFFPVNFRTISVRFPIDFLLISYEKQ